MINLFESGDKIPLHDANGRTFYFRIARLIDSGASVRCYKAERQDKSGILRQVKLKGAAAENYLRSYSLLRDAMLESDSIKSFIPSIEIYCDADEQPYVWSDEPELITFEKLCADFQRDPQPDAACNLMLALNAIKYLTQCICELHNLGLIHRDIKPSNFGFVKRGDEILTQTVSLFDVDSICSVYVEPRIRVFTPGFSELGSRADNLSDIYSIGATFFAALIGKPYDDLDFDDIKNLVDDCPLVTNVVGLHVKLKALIVKILRGCLDDRERRYQSCEELLIDLNAALDYAVPSELQARMSSDDRLMWTDVRQFLKTHRRKDFIDRLQHHLYETPIYRWRASGAGALNVAVLGCGDYAQGFLDSCLTLGQMPNVDLNVTVIGDDRADFDLYADSRPALREFFSIDGAAVKDSYGHIRFEQRAFVDEIDADEKIVRDILGARAPHYIFVALGNNKMNYIAARACRKSSESCGVCYVWEGGAAPEVEEALIPINPYDDFKRSELHRELERMAFNVHLIWNKERRLERKELRAEFRRRYYHKSCVLNVISLKYKLYGIGLDAERLSTDECAAALNEFISSGDRRLVEQLIYFEHRRWVAEKVCDGWVKRPLSECRSGVTRDHRKKNHVCIVRNDELERVSVELHHDYKDEDRRMIREAPFILTYAGNFCPVVPFDYGTTTKMFGNIAADAVIDARKIIYLLYLPNVDEAERLRANLSSDLSGLFDCAARKNLRADFEFVCFYNSTAVDDEQCGAVNDVLEEFEGLKVKWFAFEDETEIAATLEKFLRTRLRPNRLLALEKNSSQLSALLKGSGLYKKFDAYEFDMPTKKFSTDGRCALLNYIRKPAHLTIDDLFAFKQSSVVRRDKPEFFKDYKALWKLYRRSPYRWKKLCGWLATYECTTLATFDKRQLTWDDNYSATFKYIAPIECRAALEKILEALKDNDIIDADSKIVADNTSACRIFIKGRAFDRAAVDRLCASFDWLFSNPYLLTNPNVISVGARDDRIIVRLDDLIVRGLEITVEPAVLQLLRDLRDQGFITDLRIADKVDFTYPTLPLKHLLTQAGKILEIYVYHKLLDSGAFDDISCGCEITWRDTDAKNEFDCLLTKGFNSYFIECKARPMIAAEFYYKLDSLVRQFGINAKAILIADTLEKEGDSLSNVNDVRSRRGELQNVMTIRRAEDIDRIDEVIFSTLPR